MKAWEQRCAFCHVAARFLLGFPVENTSTSTTVVHRLRLMPATAHPPLLRRRVP